MKTKLGMKNTMRWLTLACLSSGLVLTTACDDNSNVVGADDPANIVVTQTELQDLSIEEILGPDADELPMGFGGGELGLDGDEDDRDGRDRDGRDRDGGDRDMPVERFAPIPFICLDIDEIQRAAISEFLSTYKESVRTAYSEYKTTLEGLRSEAAELTPEEEARMEEIRGLLAELKEANAAIAAEYRDEYSEVSSAINAIKREMQAELRELKAAVRSGDIDREEYAAQAQAIREANAEELQGLNEQLQTIKDAISAAQADNNAAAGELQAELKDLILKLRGGAIDEVALEGAQEELALAISGARNTLLDNIQGELNDAQLEIWTSWMETGEWPCDKEPNRRRQRSGRG